MAHAVPPVVAAVPDTLLTLSLLTLSQLSSFFNFVCPAGVVALFFMYIFYFMEKNIMFLETALKGGFFNL